MSAAVGGPHSGEPAIPVVSAILVNGAGAVLMQLRDDKPDLEYAAHWTLPGGTVEDGEAPVRVFMQPHACLDVVVAVALRRDLQ